MYMFGSENMFLLYIRLYENIIIVHIIYICYMFVSYIYLYVIHVIYRLIVVIELLLNYIQVKLLEQLSSLKNLRK